MRFVLLVLALAAAGAQAQSWPAKPVRMLIPFPPGGPTELLTRVVNERLQAALGQPFVIENRPGAGGNIGSEAIARAPADGYTFGISTDTVFTVNPLVYARMSFDPWKDLAPLTLLGGFSQMMVCHPSVAAGSLADLLRLAARERLSYASGGAGVPGHLAAELLLASAGVSMLHVPYKGPAPATADVMGGQVHCGFLATPTVLPHVKAGKLKAFAVSTRKRSPLAPDVPTAEEAGVTGFDAPFYLVLFMPRGVPAEVAGRMHREVGRVLAQPEVRDRAASFDVSVIGNSPEEARKMLQEAAAKWEPVVRRIGLRLD